MQLHPTKLLLGLLTPLITALSAWLAAAAAKYGVHLDATGVASVATAGAAAGAAAMVKLIHDVETQHPALERDLAAAETNVEKQLAADGWPPEPTAPQAA